jgi:ribosomal protein L7/L12
MNRNDDTRMLGDLATRLTAIEYNVQRLLGHVGLAWENPPASNALPSEVVVAMSRGDKLIAIKLLVERMGISLSQAKDAVERGYL